MPPTALLPPPRLVIVVPCHDEAEVLPETSRRLAALLGALRAEAEVSPASRICFVDDGSRDGTWSIIQRLADGSTDFDGIKLARNYGHQSAVLAGLLENDADATVTIDADLQDDEERIRDMVLAYRNGAEIVYGVREDRASDSLFKRVTANAYYRILRTMGVNIILHHADFRLMSRRAVQFLGQFSESNLFLRGVVPSVGLTSTTVAYSRRARMAGESKYPLARMLGLAWEGITSFSIAPLRMVATTGTVISIGAALITLWAIYLRVVEQTALPGWASTVAPLYFLGGIQILCLGIIGEYIGKIYTETKRRPRYLVDAFARTER